MSIRPLANVLLLIPSFLLDYLLFVHSHSVSLTAFYGVGFMYLGMCSVTEQHPQACFRNILDSIRVFKQSLGDKPRHLRHVPSQMLMGF
jgi:hypothetical protein